MEAVTLDLMYHIPSVESITKCEITKEDVEKNLAIEEKEEKALVEKLEQASKQKITAGKAVTDKGIIENGYNDYENACSCPSWNGDPAGNGSPF